MSSKRRIRRKACTGKRKHETVEQAQAHIRHVRKASPGTPMLSIYRCAFCGGLHIGHARGTGPRPN